MPWSSESLPMARWSKSLRAQPPSPHTHSPGAALTGGSRGPAPLPEAPPPGLAPPAQNPGSQPAVSDVHWGRIWGAKDLAEPAHPEPKRLSSPWAAGMGAEPASPTPSVGPPSRPGHGRPLPRLPHPQPAPSLPPFPEAPSSPPSPPSLPLSPPPPLPSSGLGRLGLPSESRARPPPPGPTRPAPAVRAAGPFPLLRVKVRLGSVTGPGRASRPGRADHGPVTGPGCLP